MAGKRLPVYARWALGTIRLVNGSVALAAPRLLARQLSTEAAANPVADYAFRMFGVRTVLLGVDLLIARGDALDRQLRVAPVIHASDTLAATVLAVNSRLPTRQAATVVGISAVNTVLAVVARRS